MRLTCIGDSFEEIANLKGEIFLMDPNPHFVFRVSDPQKNEDYHIKFYRKGSFSTLEHGYFTLYCNPGPAKGAPTPPVLGVAELNQFIKASMMNVGDLGFFSIPFRTRRVKESEELDLNQVEEKDISLVGYFALSEPNIERCLEIRRSLVSYEDWIIGSCTRKFDAPQQETGWNPNASWSLGHFVTHTETLRCLSIFFGDTGEFLFITKVFDGIDKLVKPLLRSE